MTICCPDHYSYSYALKINKVPAKATDRFPRTILSLALIFGFLLCLLGIYHFLNTGLTGVADIEQNLPQTNIRVHSFVSQDVFNALIALVGLGVILTTIYHFFNYKKVFFDGSNFVVKNRFVCGKIIKFSEPLYNYSGVRLRVKFYQYGILNKNKFIIELYHKDPSKIVPLYITMNPHNIRDIWKNYAQELRMPGITITEKGMVSRNFKDLSRSYKDVIAEWHLPKDFLFQLEKPSYISFKSRKSGEKMIKIQKIFLDAYSYLSAVAIVLVGTLFVYAVANNAIMAKHMPETGLLIFYALLLAIILYSMINLVAKDIIIITREKIIVLRQILFLRVREGIVDIKDIKGIDINYIPTLDRYYLALVSDDKPLIVGSKLPVEGLRWIRAMIINEIVGN